jgi:hypothetical protein
MIRNVNVVRTPEQLAAREAYEEKRERERLLAEAEARRENHQRQEEEALLAGARTRREGVALQRLKDLHQLARGSWSGGQWTPNGPVPEWSPATEALGSEIASAVRGAVATVLAPRLAQAEAELASAKAEREVVVRRLKGRR